MTKGLFLALFCAVAINASAQPIVRPILENGSTSNRITIAFLAEGFTADEADKFFSASTNVLSAFLATAPFKDYKTYFNAYAIFVPSNESGSDHPSLGIYKDTYFNSSYDTWGYYYSTSIPPNDRDRTYANGFGKVDALLQLLPHCDISLMIVNDPAYGGSGGRVPMCSMAAASREIAIHEIGHSFAGLGDEYTAPFPGFPVYDEPNTTQETRPEAIKWKAWIEPETPIPTPGTFTLEVGLFEGARYFSTGWYRPQLDCKMRTLGAPFCVVCSEALVKSIYRRVNPIDSVSPSTNQTHVLAANASLTFSINMPKRATNELSVRWFINDVPVNDVAGLTLVLKGSNVTPGTNAIKAEVRDATPLVRNDPENLLKETQTWTVNVVAAAPLLAAAKSSGAITLSYPASATNFLIQATGTPLDPLSWQRLSAVPTLVDNQKTVTVPTVSGGQFFRLATVSP